MFSRRLFTALTATTTRSRSTTERTSSSRRCCSTWTRKAGSMACDCRTTTSTARRTRPLWRRCSIWPTTTTRRSRRRRKWPLSSWLLRTSANKTRSGIWRRMSMFSWLAILCNVWALCWALLYSNRTSYVPFTFYTISLYCLSLSSSLSLFFL